MDGCLIWRILNKSTDQKYGFGYSVKLVVFALAPNFFPAAINLSGFAKVMVEPYYTVY